MKKIFHIAQIIDSLGEGGAERSLLTFAEVAIRRNFRVTVISLAPDSASDLQGFIAGRLRHLGVKIISIESRKLYHLYPFLLLLKLLVHEKFDLLQAHLSHAIILGGIAGWMTRIPVVATLHNPSPRRIGHYYIREAVWNFVLRYLVKRVIFVSRVVHDAYKKKLPVGKTDMVLNSIDILPSIPEMDRINIRTQLINDTDAKIIISVGRLVEGKGLSDLIAAFANICKSYPDILLIIVGDGPLRESLFRQVKELNILSQVLFLGFRNDARLLLSCSDVYVSASHSEGMSIALLEAMSAGLPIIATDVGEASSLLGSNRGILIPRKDPGAIESAFVYLLSNPDVMNNMGKSAQEYIAVNNSPDKWIDELFNVYKKAMGSKDGKQEINL